jgi:hypothetical protein
MKEKRHVGRPNNDERLGNFLIESEKLIRKAEEERYKKSQVLRDSPKS